jgi:hypothetical protein
MYHSTGQFLSQWTNQSRRGHNLLRASPNNPLIVLTSKDSHFSLLHITHANSTWIDSLHKSPPIDQHNRTVALIKAWNNDTPLPPEHSI